MENYVNCNSIEEIISLTNKIIIKISDNEVLEGLTLYIIKKGDNSNCKCTSKKIKTRIIEYTDIQDDTNLCFLVCKKENFEKLTKKIKQSFFGVIELFLDNEFIWIFEQEFFEEKLKNLK